MSDAYGNANGGLANGMKIRCPVIIGIKQKLTLRDAVNALIFLLLLISPIFLFGETPALSQKCDSEYNARQFDSALTCFHQITTQYPSAKEVWFNQGLCLFKLQRFREAISDFDTCLALNDTFNDARFMKVSALLTMGDLKQASDEIKRLDTKYTGYNALKKRILYYRFAVLLSRKWYYMIAIMFIVIILLAVVAKSYSLRRW